MSGPNPYGPGAGYHAPPTNGYADEPQAPPHNSYDPHSGHPIPPGYVPPQRAPPSGDYFPPPPRQEYNEDHWDEGEPRSDYDRGYGRGPPRGYGYSCDGYEDRQNASSDPYPHDENAITPYDEERAEAEDRRGWEEEQRRRYEQRPPPPPMTDYEPRDRYYDDRRDDDRYYDRRGDSRDRYTYSDDRSSLDYRDRRDDRRRRESRTSVSKTGKDVFGGKEGQRGLSAQILGGAMGGLAGHELGGSLLKTLGGAVVGAMGAKVLENEHEKRSTRIAPRKEGAMKNAAPFKDDAVKDRRGSYPSRPPPRERSRSRTRSRRGTGRRRSDSDYSSDRDYSPSRYSPPPSRSPVNMARHKHKQTKSMGQSKHTFFREDLNATLEQFDADQKKSSTSLLLDLPTELRQAILNGIIDDDEILHADLEKEARTLSAICTTFKGDVEWVVKKWQQRKEALKPVPNGAFDAYISELLAPLASAAAAVTSRYRAKTQHRGKAWHSKAERERYGGGSKHEAIRKERKTLSSMQALSGHSTYRLSGDDTAWASKKWAVQSAAELEGIELWRKLRDEKFEGLKESHKGKWKTLSKAAREKAKTQKRRVKALEKKLKGPGPEEQGTAQVREQDRTTASTRNW
ncbi:uncharacterized protein LTR77_000280 [Saxophila tyrrhenica]|uniref:F-box domain-containing protein n=1 Tax=Saxophila tyrrhenica TaxID=1690608 RepID=A0AAV9PPD1_9PEZI|nr:hypothetical protein LTR77_000280 [Saxophila tyrrhenica]